MRIFLYILLTLPTKDLLVHNDTMMSNNTGGINKEETRRILFHVIAIFKTFVQPRKVLDETGKNHSYTKQFVEKKFTYL